MRLPLEIREMIIEQVIIDLFQECSGKCFQLFELLKRPSEDLDEFEALYGMYFDLQLWPREISPMIVEAQRTPFLKVFAHIVFKECGYWHAAKEVTSDSDSSDSVEYYRYWGWEYSE